MKELVTKRLLICKHRQVNSKEIKCPFQWWGKHEAMYSTINVLGSQIPSILGLQIKIERIFSLTYTLMNLRICHF
jgi:hypothetical protein